MPLLLAAVGLEAGTWSDRGAIPGNRLLAAFDAKTVQTRFLGSDKPGVEACLGLVGRQILVATADSGWIAWDRGVPTGDQTWVYSLRRVESRKPSQPEFRRENRRLVLGFDEAGKVISVGWSCDTSAWLHRSKAAF